MTNFPSKYLQLTRNQLLLYISLVIEITKTWTLLVWTILESSMHSLPFCIEQKPTASLLSKYFLAWGSSRVILLTNMIIRSMVYLWIVTLSNPLQSQSFQAPILVLDSYFAFGIYIIQSPSTYYVTLMLLKQDELWPVLTLVLHLLIQNLHKGE